MREPEIYGSATAEDIVDGLRNSYSGLTISYKQSNHEGAIIDMLHEAFLQSGDERPIGIVLNAGAYTHTSLAIADAIRAIDIPVVEVHLSNVAAREPIRHTSLIAAACRGTIAGFGADSYRLAVEAILNI